MKRVFALALLISAVVVARPAVACGNGDSLPIAYIHSALPLTLPENAVVAEVEIEPLDLAVSVAPGVRAVVRRMIQGPPVSILILRDHSFFACGSPYDNGRSGFIVAERGELRDADTLVVYPIKVSRRDGYGLRENPRFVLPPSAPDLVRAAQTPAPAGRP